MTIAAFAPDETKRKTVAMELRPYASNDRAACLAVFDSNADQLHAAQRDEFAVLLDDNDATYFVMEHEDAILGCGGFTMDAEHAAAIIRWPLIRRDSQRLGLGRFLLLYCVREIAKLGGVQMVFLAVPGKSAAFFEKQGFKPVGVVRDGFGAGIDRVDLRMKLAVCT